MLIDVAFGFVFLATHPRRAGLGVNKRRIGESVAEAWCVCFLRVLCAGVWRIQLPLRQRKGRYFDSLTQTPLRRPGINSREAKLKFLTEHSIPSWVSRAQATGAAAVLLGLCPSARSLGGVDVFVGGIRRQPSQRAVNVTSEKSDDDRRFVGATSWASVISSGLRGVGGVCAG